MAIKVSGSASLQKNAEPKGEACTAYEEWRAGQLKITDFYEYV